MRTITHAVVVVGFWLGVVVVHATEQPAVLLSVKKVPALGRESARVKIVTRVAEITEVEGKRIGFEWFPASRDLMLSTNTLGRLNTNELTGTVSAILTASQLQSVMQALEARGGVDILTDPPITLLSGRRARIVALDSRSAVTQTDLKTIPDGSVAQISEDTSDRFGPDLGITATVGADGLSVKMSVTVTVADFLGYLEPNQFGNKPQAASGNAVGVPLEARLPEPHYRALYLMTSSTAVADGQTLLLGGLIFNDRRRIRESSPTIRQKAQQKKHLLIFITPTIIDPARN